MLRRLRPCAVLPTMRSLAWLDEWQIWMLFSSRVTNHKRHRYARRVRVWTICGACTPPSTAQVQHTVPHTSSSQVGEEFFRRIARSSKLFRHVRTRCVTFLYGKSFAPVAALSRYGR